MKIYTIRHEVYNYDAYIGHVIIANNEDEVITLAKSISADEGKDVWDKADIEYQGEYKQLKNNPFILLSDFSAG